MIPVMLENHIMINHIMNNNGIAYSHLRALRFVTVASSKVIHKYSSDNYYNMLHIRRVLIKYISVR